MVNTHKLKQDICEIGRRIYAMGGNEKAAKLSGVNTPRLLFLTFVNMGVLAATAGMVVEQRVAAELLGLSTRQVRNLVRKVERDGAKGIAHGNRGKPSPKRMAQTLVDRIVALVKERYRDFKPKFAAEKLWKRESIRVSDEKLRQIMTGAGLWRVRRHQTEVHPWREPKAHYGEMVQMDGSHHAWLEARGPKLVLMGLVDDARNRFYGRFYAYEGVYPAINVLEGWLRRFGLPGE